MIETDREVWDAHWASLRGGERSLFGSIASLVRRIVLAPAVRHYARRFFGEDGVIVEAGCGTGEASAALDAGRRLVVGLDFSVAALAVARRTKTPHRAWVAADLHALPFRDDTLAGLWNLGVMEHFHSDDGATVLREMRRALAPGGSAILFWPPELGSSRIVLAPLEWLRSKVSGRTFRFFPDEVNRLRSRQHAREMLAAGRLEPAAIDITPRDAFIHMVVVGRKPRE